MAKIIYDKKTNGQNKHDTEN